MNKTLAALLFIFILQSALATTNYRYRVYLKDKDNSGFSIESPKEFLSESSVDRRKKYNIPISESDLPISNSYLDSLNAIGARPIVQSKWLNTVVVEIGDSAIVDKINSLSIADSVKLVWERQKEKTPASVDFTYPSRLDCADLRMINPYGYAEEQTKMLNVDKLHSLGFKGKGLNIAVIDAGFKNVDRMSAFDSARIEGVYNVVHPDSSVYDEDDHGLKVFSCMAANVPGVIIGTAPEATYYLIKSEDVDSEMPIEEDYWLRAVEYADSLGVDAITSSLGYFEYDINSQSPHPSELDGSSRLISRGASIAAEKGIMVFCSAGNEGNSNWKSLTFPADARNIYTVGAVDKDKIRSNFSSIGFVFGGKDIKPDGVAMGSGCCIIEPDGNKGYANGTSFSTPILAGAAMCLWQALPWLSNKELIEILHKHSSLYRKPDIERGYGIPNVFKAYKKERKNGIEK